MSLGDRVEMKDARSAWGAGRQRVELRPSKHGRWRSLLVFLFWFIFFIGLVVAIVVATMRDDKDERQAAVEELAAPTTEQPEPTITMTEVSAGVFHLDFGGEFCDDARCLERVSGLVLERAPGQRIVSIAPIGAYGSPSALAIVTAWAP